MTIKINNQSTHPLDYNFRGQRTKMKPLYDKLIENLSKELDFEYKIGKTYIGLIKTLDFAAVRVQNQKLIFEFASHQKLTSPRFSQILHFPKDRWAYSLDLKEPKDIDNELMG